MPAAARRTSSTSAAAPRPSASRPPSASCSPTPNVKAVLVNIFAGINRCDWVAEGRRRRRCEETTSKVPLVVRLAGTNVEAGRKIIAESGIPIITRRDAGRSGRTRPSPPAQTCKA